MAGGKFAAGPVDKVFGPVPADTQYFIRPAAFVQECEDRYCFKSHIYHDAFKFNLILQLFNYIFFKAYSWWYKACENTT